MYRIQSNDIWISTSVGKLRAKSLALHHTNCITFGPNCTNRYDKCKKMSSVGHRMYSTTFNIILLHYTILSITSILQSIILRLSLPIILCQIHPKSINIFTYLFIFFRIYLQYLSIGYWAIYISLSSPLCWLSELWNNVYCRLDIIFFFIQYWKIFRIWNTIPWDGK